MPFIPTNPEGRERPQSRSHDQEIQDLTLRGEQEELARWKNEAQAARSELDAAKEEHLRRIHELETSHENALARERQKADLLSRQGGNQGERVRELEEALLREREKTERRIRELEDQLNSEKERNERVLAQEREKLRELSLRLERWEKKARPTD